MHIRSRTKDLLKNYKKFGMGKYKGHYDSCSERYPMFFRIHSEYHPLVDGKIETSLSYIEAEIKWLCEKEHRMLCIFEDSPEGFKKACDWLDEKRLSYANSLL